MSALIQINEELLSIDSELTYSDTESTKETIPVQQEQNNFVREEKAKISDRPSSKIRLFNTMNNLKMSTKNLNQVLPIEYPKEFQVVWKDISFSVKLRKNFKYFNKQILNNLSGSICSGQVSAIMGPSGAGKSTFLETLSCK